MTKKTTSRRDRDAKLRQANGGKLKSARVDRERISRAWYDLKAMHANSQQYMAQLATRMQQYLNLPVLAQIQKNGDDVRFNELQNVDLKKAVAVAMKEFSELWDMHKDRKGRCVTLEDMELAANVGNGYEKFNTDFFLAFKPIIAEMNVIFNKALKQLLDAQDQKVANQLQEAQAKAIDVNVITDVEVIDPNSPTPQYEEPTGEITGEAIADLDVPESIQEKMDAALNEVDKGVEVATTKARGQTSVALQVDDAPYQPADGVGTLQFTGKVTHAEVGAAFEVDPTTAATLRADPITN